MDFFFPKMPCETGFLVSQKLLPLFFIADPG